MAPDIQYLVLLQNLREASGGILNSFMAFITMIAVDYYNIVPALILFWAVDKRKGLTVLGSCGISRIANAALKSTFCVYRPWIRSVEVHPLPEVMAGATGYSFPSGHATSAGSLYGALLLLYRKYKGLCAFFVTMLLLTMLSRNYVGVHTPQDVLVGAATGLLSAYASLRLIAWLEKHPEKDTWVLLGSVLLCAVLLVYVRCKSYPMDYVDGVLLVDPAKMRVDSFKDPGVFFGIVLGWYTERRLVRFPMAGSTVQRVTRCCVGALLYIFVDTAVFSPLGAALGSGIGYFLTRACPPFLFMTLYPLAFTRLQKLREEEAAN